MKRRCKAIRHHVAEWPPKTRANDDAANKRTTCYHTALHGYMSVSMVKWPAHRKRPYLLRDARSLRSRELVGSKRIQEGSFSVIDVSHHAHHWRSRRQAVERCLRYRCSSQMAVFNGKRLSVGMGWDRTGCGDMEWARLGWNGVQ